MEAATLEHTDQAPEPESPEVPAEPAEKRTPQQMFRWSTWVHVGPGAESCEGVDEEQGTNECSNPLHFHAWVRLPNQFQHREIREKALAHKARRIRQLRDPETDGNAVLEADLEALARRDDGKEAVIEELLAKDGWRDYTEAVLDVRELDDDVQPEDAPEPVKKYAHIEDDERRLMQLDLMDPAERPGDEYEELKRHVEGYHQAVTARMDELRAPRREALEARELTDLLELLRSDRIEREATGAFMQVYSDWSLLLGTLRQRPRAGQGHERVFASIEAMQEAAPEVADALQEAVDDLEQTRNRQQASDQGN